MMVYRKLQYKSEILKVIAHPVRLCIIRKLMEEPCNVSEMHNCLEKPQSTISQHLAKLRAAGIIRGERKGTQVCYYITNEQVKKIIYVLFH